jgi:hypothetical protein
MSNSELDKEMILIRNQVSEYKELNEFQKIEYAAKIKKNMKECKQTIIGYQTLIENTGAFFSESPDDSEDLMTIDWFKSNMDQIKKLELLICDASTIDEEVSLYIELVKYTNNVKDYMDQQKALTVNYL